MPVHYRSLYSFDYIYRFTPAIFAKSAFRPISSDCFSFDRLLNIQYQPFIFHILKNGSNIDFHSAFFSSYFQYSFVKVLNATGVLTHLYLAF